MSDVLGVRTSTAAVVAAARHVRIDNDAIDRLAHSIALQPTAPGWDTSLHYRATGDDADERTAMWLLVLDALNFCFWGQGADPQYRWRVRWRGELVDGYTALVASLTHAVERGVPVHDPAWLASVGESDVATMLAPATGHADIPLLSQRVASLRELGATLVGYGAQPASRFIRAANGSAVNLVQQVVTELPLWRDIAHAPWTDTGLPHHEVRFYKRAQILVGDIAGGLQGSPLAVFHDLDHLTAFADYKVPQILREYGVLVYDNELAQRVDRRVRLVAGSRMEVEIRAATIVACDRIATQVRALGRTMAAAEIDWYLWSMSQQMPTGSRPYHLTVTTFY